MRVYKYNPSFNDRYIFDCSCSLFTYISLINIFNKSFGIKLRKSLFIILFINNLINRKIC